MTTTKRKQLILHVTKENKQVRAWLRLISGIRGFTDREIDVLEVILLKRQELVDNQLKGKYLSELLFSPLSRKEYIKELGITDFNFTNILSSIKKKKAILVINSEYDDVDPNLVPADEITIKFQVTTPQSNDKREEDTGHNS